MQVVLTGCPEHKWLLQEAQAYFTSRGELSVQDGLLFRSNQVINLASLRHQIIQRIHSSHMGIEGSLCRAREAYYWPLMHAKIKDFVTKCSIIFATLSGQSNAVKSSILISYPQDLGLKLKPICLHLMVRITFTEILL